MSQRQHYHAANPPSGPTGRGDTSSRLQMVTSLVRDSKAYPAQTESVVVRQVTDALRQCYTLVPRLTTYVSDRGASQRLLALMGTIPIHFRGAQYNIPVTLWIMSYHPSGAPKVYVTPTATMVVRSRHRHVDAAGLVYLPYLSEWDPAKSRIEELIGVMVSVFSQDPPVYARRVGQGVGSIGGKSGVSSGSSTPTEIPVVSMGGVGFGRVSSGSSGGSVGNGERERLVRVVKDRIKAELEGVTAAGEREMMGLLEEKEKLEASLKSGQNDGNAGKERILEGVEMEIQRLEKEKGKLESWMKANKVEDGDLGVDRIMVPQDEASEQVLECVAKDYAIQDAMDALDEAIEGELIDSETFVKEIRKLARDQFMARALLRKVKLKQAQKAREQHPHGQYRQEVHNGHSHDHSYGHSQGHSQGHRQPSPPPRQGYPVAMPLYR